VKKKKKTRFVIPLIILIILALGGAGFFLSRRAKRAGEGMPIYVVREEVSRNVIEISGNIKAARQQNIQAAGDGLVAEVHVQEGDWVRTGQILFQLDDSQERYNLANHEFQMNQERINGFSARLELMEEQREVFLKSIRDRRLEARFDGIIGQLALSKGDYAKAQDIFGYLIDRSYLRATVEVVETDASRLKAGQPVRLNFPAYPELWVDGLVLSYPAVGRITSRGATVLDTEIRINNPPDEILPGYSFVGEIIGGPDERVLTVEAAAIAYENGRAMAERLISGGAPSPEGGAGPRGPPGGGFGGVRSRGPGPSGGPPGSGAGTAAGPGIAAVEAAPMLTERVPVEVAPYGRNMVKVISGLNPGDRLLAQTESTGGGFSRGSREFMVF
jgi:multidrug efflux pump subunit AcrA (membrane-fusion protein)